MRVLVTCGAGTRTMEPVSIRGPVIIGRNCSIGPNVYIGPYTAIGDECVLGNIEIGNSIVMRGANLESRKRISDSLIGSCSTVRNGESKVPKGHKLIVGEMSFVQV